MIKFRRITSPIENIERIARRFSINELKSLRKKLGGVNWRKLKGEAYIELYNGEFGLPNCIGMNVTASEKEKSKSNDF